MRKRRRKRPRRNPPDRFDLGGLVFFSIVITGGVAIWAWKHMNERDRASALPQF